MLCGLYGITYKARTAYVCPACKHVGSKENATAAATKILLKEAIELMIPKETIGYFSFVDDFFFSIF